jgi:hypothetical protein
MALSVLPKNANYRINFQDFQDVGQVTFGLGTISDFKQVQTDPFQVAPLVKVTGSWGESDWIPLFYTPKKLYWDDPVHTAQDINPDALLENPDPADFWYYKAWMSFRGGDQVKVGLLKGVPVFVIAFADGVPRIGEDILKLICTAKEAPFYTSGPQSPRYYQLSKTNHYANQENGPDGLDLKLVQKAELHLGISETVTTYNQFSIACFTPETAPPNGVTFIEWTVGTLTWQIVVWTVRIGPILYAIYGIYIKTVGQPVYYYYENETEFEDSVCNWAQNQIGAPANSGLDLSPPPCEGTFYQNESIAPPQIVAIMIKAGIYSEDLLNQVIDSINSGSPRTAYVNWKSPPYLPDWWSQAPAALFYQTNLTDLMGAGGDKLYPLATSDVDNDYQWLFRPHTKDELQTASMWPPGLSDNG